MTTAKNILNFPPITSTLPASPDILTEGIQVSSSNEKPVQPDIVELAPYLKVAKASRSSNIYEKFE